MALQSAVQDLFAVPIDLKGEKAKHKALKNNSLKGMLCTWLSFVSWCPTSYDAFLTLATHYAI